MKINIGIQKKYEHKNKRINTIHNGEKVGDKFKTKAKVNWTLKTIVTPTNLSSVKGHKQ